jgi:hypothetical protein
MLARTGRFILRKPEAIYENAFSTFRKSFLKELGATKITVVKVTHRLSN